MSHFVSPSYADDTAPACSDPKYREFDFWLGQWRVTDLQGQGDSKSSITRAINGCVLHEHYNGSKGYYGESFNIYDSTRKVWHQTWVDNGATLLVLEGGLIDGAMVLTGAGFDANDNPAQQRISWRKNADGSVRQTWDSSTDNKIWTVVFDGLYTRQ